MHAKQSTIAAILIAAAIDELVETDPNPTHEAQLQLIKNWIEDYEETPPRNKLDQRIYDGLQTAADMLYNRIPANA